MDSIPVEELKLRILHGLPFALGNFFVYVFTHTFDSGVSSHSRMLWPTVRRGPWQPPQRVKRNKTEFLKDIFVADEIM